MSAPESRDGGKILVPRPDLSRLGPASEYTPPPLGALKEVDLSAAPPEYGASQSERPSRESLKPAHIIGVGTPLPVTPLPTATPEFWGERAEKLERLAATATGASRGRLLLSASEHWLLAKNTARAVQAARASYALGCAAAARQLRQLLKIADKDGAPPSIEHLLESESLVDAEANLATSPELRSHVAALRFNRALQRASESRARSAAATDAHPSTALQSDLSQLVSSANAFVEQAPGDLRAALFQGALRPVSPTALDATRASPAVAPLRAGLERVESLRQAALGTGPLAPDADATLAFLAARRALSLGQRREASNALLLLANTQSFAESAKRLAATLLESTQSSREEARTLYQELQQKSPSLSLRRAQLRSSVEVGEPDLQTLEQRGEFESALPLPLSVAFLTLFHPNHALLRQHLATALGDAELGKAASSVGALLEPPLPGVEGLSESNLGRLLGRAAGGAELSDALTQSTSVMGPLREVLELEVAHQTKAYASAARRLLQLPPHGDAALPQLAAALLLEAHDAESAAIHYQAALSSPHFGNAAQQALNEITRRLAEASSPPLSATAEPERRALALLTSALTAVTQSGVNNEAVPDSLPAPTSSDGTARLQHWLAAEAKQLRDPLARSLLTLRQALAAERDPTAVSRYLESVQRGSADDLSLLAIREHLVAQDAPALARHRLQAAVHLPPSPLATALLLDASLSFEHSRQADSAAAGAEQLAQLNAADAPFADPCLERNAQGTRLDQIRDRLLESAESAESPLGAAELYLRLSDLEGRDATLAQRSLYLSQALSHNPSLLRALLEYEHLAMRATDTRGLAAVEFQLAVRHFAVGDGAHLALAARFEELENGWNAASRVWGRVQLPDPLPMWLLRRVLPHMNNGAQRRTFTTLLRDAASNEADRSALSLRLAEMYLADSNPLAALEALEAGLDASPKFLVAETARAELLAGMHAPARAAEAFERVGKLTDLRVHRAAAYRRAAGFWRQAEDPERAVEALERSFRAYPEDSAAFDELMAHFQGLRSKAKLLELIEVRASALQDSSAQLEVQLLEGQVLAEYGEASAARQVLEQVLKEHPQEVRALQQLAALVELQANAEGTEQTLLRLSRLSPDPLVQADAYARLATLYEGTLAQPERARRCYEEVLRRRPSDFSAFERLVELLLAEGHVELASQLLNDQLPLANTLEEQRVLALSAARIQARSQDFIASEFSYRQALQRWPRDSSLLAGLIELYLAIPDRAALSDLGTDLSRDVETGLPDGAELEQAVGAARLFADQTRDACGATLVNSFQKLLAGSVALWPGAHGRAMARNLDELLAPNPISSALRTLLMQTHAMLDRAFELDLQELEASAVDNPRVQACFETKARAVGVVCPQIYSVSNSPRLCLITNNPSRVVLGSDWIENATPACLDFMAWRSLKLIQARAGIIERLRGQQLLATMEAFLGCFVESKPSLSDPRLVEAMRRRLTVHLPSELDDDLPVLALTVMSELKTREQPLDEATRRWANRSALLATGDLRSALAAILYKQGETLGTGRDAIQHALRQSQEACDLVKALFERSFLDACRLTREAGSA